MNPGSQPETTREAILVATLELLGAHGLRGTTTRAIADLAGVNEVTIFRKFGTKHALVREAISSKLAEFAVESVAYTGDVEADLTRLVTGYEAMLEEFGPVARSVLTEVPFDDRTAPAVEALRAVVLTVSDLLVNYQKDGVIRPEPISTMVPALLGPIVMPVVTGYALMPQDQEAYRLDAETHVKRFLYGRAVGG